MDGIPVTLIDIHHKLWMLKIYKYIQYTLFYYVIYLSFYNLDLQSRCTLTIKSIYLNWNIISTNRKIYKLILIHFTTLTICHIQQYFYIYLFILVPPIVPNIIIRLFINLILINFT